MLRFAATTARRSAVKRPARFLASAKHAAKPRPPERDLSSRQLFAALGLRTFSREELRQRFDAADADADGYLTRHEAAELFGRLRFHVAHRELRCEARRCSAAWCGAMRRRELWRRHLG